MTAEQTIIYFSKGKLLRLLLFSILFKLRDNRPGLIIDHTGFTNNTNPFSPGFTPWSDVESITTTEVRKQKFIVIRLKDRSRAPINISPDSLLCNFDEMLLHFQTHFNLRTI